MEETAGSILAKLLMDRDAGKDISKLKEDFRDVTQKHFGDALVDFTFETEDINNQETSKIAISGIDLQASLNKAIEEEEFNSLEISGFEANYKLSLLAGAIIGYRLAIEDSSKLLNLNLESS